MRENNIVTFVRNSRKEMGFTQQDLAIRSGLSLHFIQNLEQGKESLQMDKVNELLNFFNAELYVKVRTK